MPADVAPSFAVVTCVEAGMLEDQTVRMIDSLRRFGGRAAGAEVFAVQPRAGAPIGRATRAAYDRLNVTFVRAKGDADFAWYKMLNKPVAVLEADRRTSAEVVCWLDADVVLAGEPTDLMLPADVDFTACPTERNIATTGPGDPLHPFWQAMCAAVGLDVDRLPWVTEQRTGVPVRAYFNAGVFSYRRASGYAAAYLDACHKLMRARIELSTDGVYYHEQTAAGLAMVTAGCRWRVLAETHNYEVSKHLTAHMTPAKLAAARVIHYHQSMRPDYWAGFLDLLRPTQPAVADWLAATYGPLQHRVSAPRQALIKLFYKWYHRQEQNYLVGCRRFERAA